MSKPRLCIDIDNVIAQTDAVMRQVIRDYTGGRVNLAYKHVVEFDYHKCKDGKGRGISKEEWDAVHKLFSEPRYLWLIQPAPGALEALKTLADTFVFHLATSRLPKARRTTIEWLDAHGFPAHDLHFLKHGEKHESLGKFPAGVEDHYEQAVAFADAGTPCYVMAHPWNKGRPAKKGVRRVKNWGKLTAELLALK